MGPDSVQNDAAVCKLRVAGVPSNTQETPLSAFAHLSGL